MASPRPQPFAALLRRYRLAAGLTQEALAERARLSAEAIGTLERGQRRAPHRDTLALLADALALTPEDRALLEASVSRPRTIPAPVESPAAPSPLDPAPRPPGNLPAALTPLIGREREEAAAVHLLHREDVRLLTLTGAPGIGKTRLALQVAADLADDAPDGVYLVELAPIAEPALVFPTVMRALGIQETGAAPAALTTWLRARRVLLLLDNCEQVATAAPQVADLLRACAGLKVLATSRIPLRVRGEHRFAVPPLALPDLAALPPAAELAQFAAVALFVQRARAVKPTFALTAAQASAVATICHRLDGLPLAIELAAPWVRLLPPTALLARLTPRLPLLEAGGGDAPERQRTLRGAIAWSHDLLSPAEQTLLRRLGVFVGGWTLEAAEAVCAEPGDIAAVLPALAALVDASLVDQQEEAAGGEIRFRLLELVHEFALERLEASGEAEEVRARHAAYYTELAETAYPNLEGPTQRTTLDQLDREFDNFHAMLGWAREHGESALALRALGSLVRFWKSRGHLREGRRWLDALLPPVGAWAEAADMKEMPPAQAPDDVLGRAFVWAGMLATWQEDYPMSLRWLRAAEHHARRAGDVPTAIRALSAQGVVAHFRADPNGATRLYEQALALAREVEDPVWIAASLNNLGCEAEEQGDIVRAAAHYTEAIGYARRAGYQQGLSNMIGNLGELKRQQGELEQALALVRESLALKRDLGNPRMVAEELEFAAMTCAALGADERTARLLGAAAAARLALGAPQPVQEREATEQAVAGARVRLGRERWEAAFTAGRSLSLDQAVAEALKGDDSPPPIQLPATASG